MEEEAGKAVGWPDARVSLVRVHVIRAGGKCSLGLASAAIVLTFHAIAVTWPASNASSRRVTGGGTCSPGALWRELSLAPVRDVRLFVP